MLFLVGQASEQGCDLHSAPSAAFDGLHRVTDVALAREEAEDIALAFGHELLDGLAQSVKRILVHNLAAGLELEGTVANLDGEGAPRDLNNGRRRPILGREMGRKALRVNRRRRNDDLEVRTLGQQALQIAQQEVDIQRTFVRLVNNDRVIGVEEAVALHLREQNTVRHELDRSRFRHAVVEADGVANGLADLLIQLVRDALGDGACGQTTGLRVTDESAASAAEFQADLGDLRGLTGTGFTSDNDDLVVADGLRDVLLARRDGQRVGVGHLRNGGIDKRDALLGRLDVAADSGAGTLRAGFVEPALETARLSEGYLLKRGEEFLARRGCGVFRHSCAPVYPPLRVAFRCRRARRPAASRAVDCEHISGGSSLL